MQRNSCTDFGAWSAIGQYIMGFKTDLENQVNAIFRAKWERREGRKVPEDTDLSQGNEAVDLEATILYTDLSESTKLVDNYKDWFAAANYKAFLQCATRIIRNEGGQIRSFDGDRVMGVFLGDRKNTSAVRCALKINWAVKNIVQPKLKQRYKNSKYVMRHVTGIDSTKIMATKAGIRNSNDIVWIGKAANHAAKLSSMSDEYPTWITDSVYDKIHKSAKFSNEKNMWEKRIWTSQHNRRIYRSTYWWEID